MFERKSNWLLNDDELHPADRPGSADWFTLTDEVGRGRANQRSDVIKIESLLGRAGLFDVERLDGPLGYANEQLDKPIRDFQRKNGLAVDGYLRPEGPTIGKFKELYGGEYAPFPAPTPAMIDAHHARRDQGEDGFLVDRWPALDVRPHPRLDPLQKDFGFDDWNEAWVRFQAGQRGTFDGMPEELLKNIAQNDVRGIVQARDVARRWAAYRPEDGSAFARHMVQALEGKPILQSAFLAGPVPQSPPLGVPTATGLADYGKFVLNARAAEGIAEPASQAEAPSSKSEPTPPDETAPAAQESKAKQEKSSWPDDSGIFRRPRDLMSCADITVERLRETERVNSLNSQIADARSKISDLEARIAERERPRTLLEVAKETIWPEIEIEPKYPTRPGTETTIPFPVPVPIPAPVGMPGPIPFPMPIPTPLPRPGQKPEAPFEIGIDPKSIRLGERPKDKRYAEAEGFKATKEGLEKQIVTWESSRQAALEILKLIGARSEELGCR